MIRLKHLRIANFKALRDVELGFPEVGSVLIEGLNESGKSTLFEAVYFALYGRPLVSDIESTVSYQAKEAFVELAFMVDATEIVIGRSIRIGRQNRAKLTIRRPGELPEIITQLAAINRRVPDELGRLDGETLLNSCFVEQKKLQRLEGLDSASRQRSLLRLLNLESLGELETQFKVRGQDDESIRLATQRRDLAQIQLAIPATEAELARTDRRLAARHILAGLGRIDDCEREITGQHARRIELEVRQRGLQDRLGRIVQLGRTETLLAGIQQALTRRRGEESTAEALRRDIDEILRVLDVDLPALLKRLDSIQNLTAQMERLEAAESGLVALREGAAQWTLGVGEEQRAERLQAECAAVGEQLSHAIALHQTLQLLDDLEGRIRQQGQVGQTIDELAGQQKRLQGLERDLPGDRDRVRALLDAADALSVAEEESAAAAIAQDQALAFQNAVDALSRSRTAQAVATQARDTVAGQLGVAERELQDAQATRAKAVGPALRAWIAAREDCDRTDQARRDEMTASTDVERTDGLRQSAEAAARSAIWRTMLLAGGAGVSLVAGVVLFLLSVAPVVGAALVVLALVAGALAVRANVARRRLETVAGHARSESANSRQRLTGVQAVIGASGTVGPERLVQAEDMLRAIGQEPPADLSDAQRLLASAREQDADAERALERVRLAQAELNRLNQAHGVGQMKVTDTGGAVEAAVQRLDEARAAAAADLDSDPMSLVAVALQRVRGAAEQLAAAIAIAVALLADATPQGLRVEVASVQRRVQLAELEVGALPDTIARLMAAEQQSALMAEQIGTDRAALETRAQALGISATTTDLATLRSEIKQLGSDTSEADLRQTQTRLNTDIGGAQTAAQQHRQQATNAWRRASDLAVLVGPEETGPLLELVQVIARIAASMSADAIELDRLEGAARIERGHLAEQAAEVNEPLDLGRLRSASAEIGIEQRQMQARLAKLPELEAQHLRAFAVLAETDSQIATAWSDVDERLAKLEVLSPERDAMTLRTRLHHEIAALDEPGTRTALDGAIAEIADADASIRQRQSQIGEEQRAVVQHLRAVDLSITVVDRSNLELVLPEIAAPDLPEQDVLDAERDRLLGQLSYLDMTRQELESSLDLIGVALDLPETEAELARQIRARLVKLRATSIITLARLNMINRVLPGTEQNLRLLLPQLTADRYCDAKLDPTYKLTVWDTAAQRYIEKDIFSGGTRDQFSLALRLAFALATLPQELGTTPGFIFLDEPLSAFDIPRTGALVELLTRGQIAKSFAQIFLISHSRSFDPSLFGYYVRMEAGRVAETNLPRPVAEILLPMQPEAPAA